MTTIYLIRHAEAEGNLYRIVQGHGNSNLTDRGWRQVQALERRFAGIHIDAVYASDLYRTCATATAIYRPRGLPLRRIPALREIYLGPWEHRTWGDIYRRWPEQMRQFGSQPALWYMEGAELPLEARDRVLAAIRAIAAENDGKTVAVFSHGYVIRLLLALLQGYSQEETGQTPTGDNTAVSLLEAEGEDLRVVFRDDNSHLKTPEYLSGGKERKRANGLEPGLWFQPLRLPEQAELFCSLVSGGWEETRPFDAEKLLADANRLQTLVGYLRKEPVGILQLGEMPGWITLACIRPDCRKRGFGVQLIGQAVQYARERGAQALSIALAENSGFRSFFTDCGFSAVGKAEDGRVIYEKDIRFDSELMQET